MTFGVARVVQLHAANVINSESNGVFHVSFALSFATKSNRTRFIEFYTFENVLFGEKNNCTITQLGNNHGVDAGESVAAALVVASFWDIGERCSSEELTLATASTAS